MATVKNIYATKATITCTLTSLANASLREATVIDNTTNAYLDMLLRVRTKGQASGTSVLEVWAYAALGDTNYTGIASGTDAAYTGFLSNCVFVGAVTLNAATTAVTWQKAVAWAFGGVLPDKIGFIFKNSSGAALSATAGDHVIEYEGITNSVA